MSGDPYVGGDDSQHVIRVTVDNTAPNEGSLIINNDGLYTNNRNVVLDISASDAISDIVEMSIANGNHYYDWEPYATTIDWQLPDSDGEKTVRAKFRDAAGNETPTPFVSDTIILDREEPASEPTSPEPGHYNDWDGVVSGISNDDQGEIPSSGVSGVEVSIKVVTPTPEDEILYWNGDNWEVEQSWVEASGAEVWTYSIISPIEGTYTFYSRATDNVGNTEATGVLEGFVYDITNPQLSWTSPVESTVISGTTVILSVATDNLSGVESVSYFYQRDDGVDDRHDIAVLTSSPYEASWDTTGLELDDYNLKAVAADRAGNSFEITRQVGVGAVVSGEDSTTPSQTTAVITWTTDRPTSSRVVYDTVAHSVPDFSDLNYGYAYSTATFDTSPKVTNHSVEITGLSDGTPYYYRTISAGSPKVVGDQRFFRTLTYAGSPAPSGGGAVTSVLGTSTFGTGTDWEGYQKGNQEGGEVLGDEEAVEDEFSTEKGSEIKEPSERVLGDAVEGGLWRRIRIGIIVLGVAFIVLRFFFRKKKK